MNTSCDVTWEYMGTVLCVRSCLVINWELFSGQTASNTDFCCALVHTCTLQQAEIFTGVNDAFVYVVVRLYAVM